MNIRGVIRLVPNLWDNRQLIGLICGVIMLSLGSLFGAGKVQQAVSMANQVNKETAEKTSLIQEWRNKVVQLQGYTHRPVNVGQVEELQGTVFRQMDLYHLNLLSFGIVGNAAEEGKIPEAIEFELSFNGAWADSVRFLQDFQLGSALVVIKNVKMEPESGAIKTYMKYKVYITN